MTGSGAAMHTFSVHAACIRGAEAQPVTVEVSFTGGIPGITLVGMADAAVNEAPARIRCALRGSGYDVPRKSIIVNLAPADMRKTGSGLDLAISISILALSGQIPVEGLDSCLFVGELSLDGYVMPVRGEVAYAMLARDCGLRLVSAHGDYPVALPGVDMYCLRDLSSLRAGLASALDAVDAPAILSGTVGSSLDYADVKGQELAKRALAIAATGGLGLMMVGPPGSGKTMLAERMGTILPPIDEVELREALCIHSVAGESVESLLASGRPFRCPHHSISAAGLVGGGRPVRPGEISLAHGGVLFLDELAEFPSSVLQLLRQPLESKAVRIVRADGAYVFPAHFQLLVASNPCPCGYLGDRDVSCACPPYAVARYQAKLAGPLADRIDMRIDVARPDPDLLLEGGAGASSSSLRSEVEQGRAFATWRLQHGIAVGGIDMRAINGAQGVAGAYALDSAGYETLLAIAQRGHLTGRGIVRLCRIARTIADMQESREVGPNHVFEASMFRGRCSDAE